MKMGAHRLRLRLKNTENFKYSMEHYDYVKNEWHLV